MGQRIPGISKIIEVIRRKKTRDSTIVAVVIAVCIIISILYAMSK